jgi:hypothetical protein
MWEFDDAVEVHTVAVDGIETPDQFLWRGRLWRVCSIESHRTETAVWWERGVIGTGSTVDPRRTDPRGDGRLEHWSHAARAHLSGLATTRSRAAAVRTALATTGSVTGERCSAGSDPRGLTTSPAAVGVLDADWGPQRSVYRVEAGCGRHGRQELFDLAHDPDSNRWQLERVTDR